MDGRYLTYFILLVVMQDNSIYGQISTSSTLNGQINTSSSSYGQMNTSSTLNGQMNTSSTLNGQMNTSSTLNGQINTSSTLNGQINTSSTLNGQMNTSSTLNGQINASSSLNEQINTSSFLIFPSTNTVISILQNSTTFQSKHSSTIPLDRTVEISNGRVITTKTTPIVTSSTRLNKTSLSNILLSHQSTATIVESSKNSSEYTSIIQPTISKSMWKSSIITSLSTNETKVNATIETTPTTTTTKTTTTTTATTPPPTTTVATTTEKPIPPKAKLKILLFERLGASLYNHADTQNHISAANVAINIINEDDAILPNHELVIVEPLYNPITVGFAMDSALQATQAALDKNETADLYALVGPASSLLLVPTAEILSSYAVIQMNYIATHPDLTSKENYPRLFSIKASVKSANKAIVALFEQNNWKRAVLIYGIQTDNPTLSILELKTLEHLGELMRERNIEYELASYQYGFIYLKVHYISNITLPPLKKNDYRIFITGGYLQPTANLMCQAYRLGMTGPKYYWIFVNTDDYRRFHAAEGTHDCAIDEMHEATKRMIYTDVDNHRRDGVVTIAKQTSDELWDRIVAYRNKLEEKKQHQKPIIYNRYSFVTYDCMWAVALMLDKAFKVIPDFQQYYTYKNFTTVNKLVEIMEEVHFEGATGRVQFSKFDRDRLSNVLLKQYFNGTFTIVGEYNIFNNTLFVNQTIQDELIPGYVIPRDGVIKILIEESFDDVTLGIIWSFAFMATLLALWFFYKNVKHRKRLFIKMSSPRINNLIILGCILCYLAVVLYGLDVRTISKDDIPTVCNIVIACLTYGFTFAFGALFSKTWRIYRIFTSVRSLKTSGIQDMHLFAVIFMMTIVDTIIIATWMINAPYKLFVETLSEELNKYTDTVTKHVMYRCECERATEFGVAIFLYKGLLLILGLFLAWETRNIKVLAINDSKYIGLSVYSVAVLASIGSICSFALYQTTMYMESYVVFAIYTLLCTTITLCLVFAPKIKMIASKFEDPNFRNGRPVLSETPNSNMVDSSSFLYKSEGTSSEYPTIKRKDTVESTVSDYDPRLSSSTDPNGRSPPVFVEDTLLHKQSIKHGYKEKGKGKFCQKLKQRKVPISEHITISDKVIVNGAGEAGKQDKSAKYNGAFVMPIDENDIVNDVFTSKQENDQIDTTFVTPKQKNGIINETLVTPKQENGKIDRTFVDSNEENGTVNEGFVTNTQA